VATAACRYPLPQSRRDLSFTMEIAVNSLKLPVKFDHNLPFIEWGCAQPESGRPVALRKPCHMGNDWQMMARGWSIDRGKNP
jgi:hypothetical protein